jgi:single-strand DNA-binding protein
MHDTITLTGLVATVPRHVVTAEGLQITSFRLASTSRRFDKETSRWVDGETNWFTVSAFRQLATNAAVSMDKGDRVMVTGRLRIRSWENGDRSGISVEVDADAIGHDLNWGASRYTRTPARAQPTGSRNKQGEDAPVDPDRNTVDGAQPEPDGTLVPERLEAAAPF